MVSSKLSLEQLQFDNRYLALPQAFYRLQNPSPYSDHHLVSFNPEAAALIDLDPEQAQRPEFIDYLSGKNPLPGSQAIAMCYAGHQFGHYVPQLGDGRAILLGQVRNQAGDLWDLHLKGSGPTPHSRQGDGSEIEHLLQLLRRPFDEQPDMESYAAAPPSWAQQLELSCSS